MFNTPEKGTTRERATIIAVQNLQADLRAGFTAARDMSSHTNGYADVAMRDAINQGDLDGPRFQVAGRGIRWSATPPNPSAPDDPLAGTVDPLGRRRARRGPRPQGEGRGLDQALPDRRLLVRADRRGRSTSSPIRCRCCRRSSTKRIALGLKAACHAFGGEGLQNAITAGCDTIEHGYGLTQAQLDQMVAKKLDFDPTLARYTAPYMDDNDAKATGGKFRMIPIFEKAVSMAVATKGLRTMVGSGVDGGPFPHGTQALEFELLVKRAGMTPVAALQAGTIVNARVMGWADQIGSIAKGKFADLVAVPGDPTADITGFAACAVCDEGREGDPTGLSAAKRGSRLNASAFGSTCMSRTKPEFSSTDRSSSDHASSTLAQGLAEHRHLVGVHVLGAPQLLQLLQDGRGLRPSGPFSPDTCPPARAATAGRATSPTRSGTGAARRRVGPSTRAPARSCTRTICR